jgi:hypothetical protein
VCGGCRRVAATTFTGIGAFFLARARDIRVKVTRLATSIPVGVNSIRWMQSTRPSHHANASRSLFQNPWTLADLTPSASNYLPAYPTILNFSTLLAKLLTIPNIPLERVRNSGSHPHPPIKVVKPDWGHSTRAAASSDPNLKATWLGHAVSSIAAPL